MLEEKFSSGDSFFHKLDPRIKIIVAVLFSIVVAIMDKYITLAVALIFSLGVMIIARLNIKQVFSCLLIVNSFLLFCG